MASARQIRDEIMKMTIVVNSDPAQKAIYELDKKTNQLVADKRKLSKEIKETEALLGKESAEYKALAKEILATSKEITSNKKEMERLRGEMDITQMTMTQLKQEAKLLRASLDNMVPGSEASKALDAQLAKVNARMAEIRSGASGTSLSFKNLADKFNHYSGIVTACAGVLIGFGLTVQNIIDRNNKLVDAQTAVAKTVGMTTKEVQDLTKTFSDFDTRTSKIDLLKIAETGGRLGVQKSEIADFVQEVDKANVALGDGFAGGVEAVTDTLGKLKGLYSETKDLNIATAINQIGSAMNELGANGAASEQNIGEFAMRLGSLPEKLKPTIAEALALGAAFEESGIDAERASTAYANVIRTAARDADKFAKVMNISKKEVEDLMNKDPLEFFLKFSEGAKGLDTTELAKMLDYLKLNDQYVISAMGSASENTDRFRNSIELSNKSLSEATSLQLEFDKVNNNSAAIYEKVQKKLAGIFANESVAKGLNFLIEGFGKMIGAVDDTDGYYRTFGQTVLFLTKLFTIAVVAIFSFNTAIALSNLTMATARTTLMGYTVVQKISNLLSQTSTAFQNLLTASYLRGQIVLASLTGNTVRQAAAQRMLNTVTIANPYVVLVSVIMAAVAAYALFSKRTDEAIEKQKFLNDINKETNKGIISQKNELESLLKVARDRNASDEVRIAAIKKLNELSPEYLGNLTLENINTKLATESINKYTDAIYRASRARVLQKKLDEKVEEQDDLKSKSVNEVSGKDLLSRMTGGLLTLTPSEVKTLDNNMFTQMKKWEEKGGKEYAQSMMKQYGSYYEKRNQALQKNGETIGQLQDELAELMKQDASIIDSNGGKSTYNIPGDDPKKDKSGKSKADQLKKQHDDEMKQLAKDGQEAERLAMQIALDTSDAKIEAMEEGLRKELAEINMQELRKIEAINSQKVGDAEIKSLQKKIDKAKGNDKVLFQALMNSWLANNEALEKEKTDVRAVFDLKRDAAEFKEETRQLEKLDKAHQRELGHIQRQHNEELASYQTLAQLKEGLKGRMDEAERKRITTWAEGKEALSKIYQKRELELQVTHLEAMVKLYEGLDLGILTPQQREEVMKFIDEAGNKIAEFKAKISGQDQDDPKKKKKRGSGDKNGKGGGIDILGLSADSWDNLLEDIKAGTASATEIVSAAATAMQNAFSSYFAFVEANEKRQLATFTRNTELKKARLKKQLLDGYINQETYKKQTLAADQELEKKKAEMEIKAAKRQRIIKIAEIITSTSLAIMQAYAQLGPIAGTVAAALVGTLGAIQIATVMKTPLPSAEGYEDGFGMDYPIERAQDGKRFNVRRRRLASGLVDRPTHFIAGENNKVEMVIDNPTWTSYPDELKRAIYSANARAKGFENGFNTVNTSKNKSSESSDDTMIMLISTVNRLSTTVDNLQKYGIEAKIAKTARNGKEVQDMQKMYDQLNNKNKH